MIGILALAVGIMLSSSNNAIQRSADRIAYEEAYQTALAGTHIARAWLVNPELAGTMTGGASVQSHARARAVSSSSTGISSDLDTILQKAVTMNQQIMEDVKNGNYNDLYGPAVRFGDLVKNTTLSGGRKLVYTFPMSPVVSFASGPGKKGVSFNGAPEGGHKSYVEWVRLTTPGTDNETSASLRETTFIVEAKGVAEYAGVKKERVVQQRVLIKPNEPQNPLIGANEAILTQRFVKIKGQSSLNVHWAPVYAREHLHLDFFDQITDTMSQGKRAVTLKLNNSKANIAGALVYESGGKSFPYIDEWLQYKTGVGGKLLAQNDGVELFGALTGYNPNSTVDFFKELAAGTFTYQPKNGSPIKSSINDLVLTNQGGQSPWTGLRYSDEANITTSRSNPNGLFDPNNDYTGALVQGDPNVDTRVNEFFTQMNYADLRDYAEDHNAYYTWNGSTLTNVATGETGINPMDLGNTNDPLDPSAPSDKMLFVDSVDQDPTKPFTQPFTMPGYWKGVVYVNGPMQFSGSGNGTEETLMRSPSQFTQYRQGQNVPSDILLNKHVVMDGIIICNGVVDASTGGAIVYGTVAAKDGIELGANFSVFYNPANGEGRLRDTSSEWQPYNLVSGKLYEVKSGGLTDS